MRKWCPRCVSSVRTNSVHGIYDFYSLQAHVYSYTLDGLRVAGRGQTVFTSSSVVHSLRMEVTFDLTTKHVLLGYEYL